MLVTLESRVGVQVWILWEGWQGQVKVPLALATFSDQDQEPLGKRVESREWWILGKVWLAEIHGSLRHECGWYIYIYIYCQKENKEPNKSNESILPLSYEDKDGSKLLPSFYIFRPRGRDYTIFHCLCDCCHLGSSNIHTWPQWANRKIE